MIDARSEVAPSALGLALKDSFQVAYVASNGEAASEALQRTIGVGPFDHSSGTLDVIDADGDVQLTPIDVWFALDKSIEIIQPVEDPCALFDVSDLGEGELRFHHVATCVRDLEPCLAAARARSLRVFRTRIPGVAFVDLRAVGGHWLEILCDTIVARTHDGDTRQERLH